MSGGDEGLSVLPDDLLRRVLYFAPAREGASTGALSKRWRGLWRSSGAVNLEARLPLPEEAHHGGFFSRRDAFVAAARSSLEAAASDSPVTRLTFRVVAVRGGDRFREFLRTNVCWKTRSPDVVTELLSLPAVRRVEELRLAAEYADRYSLSRYEEIASVHTALTNELSLLCLPSATLRVLDVAGCGGLQPSPSVAFPRLASLRLSHCRVRIEHLQDFIHAAPALATVHLESAMIWAESACEEPPSTPGAAIFLLHCPAATELVLDRCRWVKGYYKSRNTIAVEIEAPRLQRFRYHGLLRQLALRSQSPDLARVDLHILPDVYHSRGNVVDARSDLVTFWRLARNFSNARELRLRVNKLEDIAVVGPASQQAELLLCSFRNLERLHLEGMHKLKGKTAAVAVANLLSCCPVLRDLRINLTMAQPDSDRGATEGRCFLEEKYRHDLERSIHCFNNRKLEAINSNPIKGDYDDDDGDARYHRLPDLPALSSGQVFDCLLSTLSCVRLQVRLEASIFELNLRSNFAAKLIKFFAENAAVLKEMHIDDGNGKISEHMNCKLQRWVANSSEKRNFVVLPLES